MAEYTIGGLYLPNRNDSLPIDQTLADNFIKIQELFDDIRITVEGANAAGGADDSVALQSALDRAPEGATLELKKNGIYNISANLIRTKNIKINGNGSKIVASHASAIPLQLTGEFKFSTTALAYGSTDEFINLNSTTGLAVGDQLRIYHKGELFDSSRAYYYKGGNVLVTKIVGSKVYINSKFPFSMGAGATVDVYKPIVCEVNDLEIVHTGTLGTQPYGAYGLNIKFAKFSRVNNVKIDNYNHNFKIDMTVNCIMSCIESGRSYWSGSSESYGLSNYGGNNLLILNSSLMSGRHGITVTGQETSYGTTLINCHLGQEAVDLAGLDCHGCNFSLTAINCHVYRFNLAGNCILQGCTVYSSELGNENSFQVAESYERANYIIRDCTLFSTVYNLNAYGQQATSTRKYIGSIVFENTIGNGNHQITLRSRDKGASVQAMIETVIIRNGKQFTLLYDDQVDYIFFENVETSRDAKLIEQLTDSKTVSVKVSGTMIPARYRTISLINFERLVVEDCIWTVIDQAGASFLVTSAGAYVDCYRTDLSKLGRGIESSSLFCFTTTESSGVNFPTPANIGTRRRVDYVAL